MDGDGELSSDELRAAIVSTLKRTTSTQDAEDLIQILDSDKDGKGDVALIHSTTIAITVTTSTFHNSFSGGAFGLY